MALPKIRIESCDGITGTRIWIDGTEIHGVTNVVFGHPVGSLPSIELVLRASEVQIEGAAVVHAKLLGYPPSCRLTPEQPLGNITTLEDAFARYVSLSDQRTSSEEPESARAGDDG